VFLSKDIHVGFCLSKSHRTDIVLCLVQMIGSGEVISKLQMSLDELLNHEDEPFGE
jgi:hypothetical protein